MSRDINTSLTRGTGSAKSNCDSNNLNTIASLNITDLTDSKNANDIFSCSNDILKKTVTVSRIYTNTFFK